MFRNDQTICGWCWWEESKGWNYSVCVFFNCQWMVKHCNSNPMLFTQWVYFLHGTLRSCLCSRWINEVNVIVNQGLVWWRCTAFNKITLAVFRALLCFWTVALSNVVKDRNTEWGLETNSGNRCFFLLTSCWICPCWLSDSYVYWLFFKSHRLLPFCVFSFGICITYMY